MDASTLHFFPQLHRGRKERKFIWKTYLGKYGGHQDSAQGSRLCCRCQCGTERGCHHMRCRRKVLCPGRFCRRSGILQRENYTDPM